jgi:hypothetical protein
VRCSARDNSFFVEEAFNQEGGSVQSVLVWQKTRGSGWDLGENQLIVGAAAPVTTSGQGPSSIAVLGYFSYEIQFRRRHI